MPRLRGSANQAAQTVNSLDFTAGRGKFPESLGANNMLIGSSGGS